MEIVEQIAGAIATVVVLLDIFLTVLYARAGTELLSRVVARTTWLGFRLVSRPFGRHRGTVLTFCGPVILVTLIFVWAAGLALGAALIMHPHLGAGLRASMLYDAGEIDAPTFRPEVVGARPPFEHRLRDV